MVYECQCGCKLINDNPRAVERHKKTIKHMVLLHGGTLEDLNTINNCQKNVRRLRVHYEDSHNPLKHDLMVLQLYLNSLGLPDDFIDLNPYHDVKIHRENI